MKNILAFCIVLLTVATAWAQQTVKRTNTLCSTITEVYSVLKANKKLREGDYLAVTPDKITVAKGFYKNGKRAGTWDFFDGKGKHVQSFDYDRNELTFEDEDDLRKQQYYFREPNANDTLAVPIKIGGNYYGFHPLTNPSGLIGSIIGDFRSYGSLVYTEIFTINEKGELLMHQVEAWSVDAAKHRTYRVDRNAIPPEYTLFAPAKAKGIPVPCVIVTHAVPVNLSRITYRLRAF